MHRLAVVLLLLAAAGCASTPLIPSGTYFGYESLCNLSSEEDPDAYWFHENTLTVKGNEVQLEKAPRHLSKGKVWASASDGGFFTYKGTMEHVGGRLVITFRDVKCDYCARRVDAPPVEEYIVPLAEDGTFHVNHVRYSKERNAELSWKPGA